MMFQISHPENKIWTPIEVSSLSNLLEDYRYSETMIQSSIKRLRVYKHPMELGIGTFKIVVDNLEEADSVREILEYTLRNNLEKK